MTTLRIALIHALAHSVEPINTALARDWPSAVRMNLLDDSLSADLAVSAAQGRGLDAAMHARFARLAQYAVDCGSQAILFTCSAFGPCIEAVARTHAAIPVLKPNEAMIDEAVALGTPVGLLASFAPTLASMPPEFPSTTILHTGLAQGALAALNAGEGDRHDALVAEAALRLKHEGAQVIALAQFSLARARDAVAERTGLPVLTTVDSIVRALRARLA